MSYEETRQRRRDWKMSAVFIVTGVFIGILLTVQIKSSIPAATFLSDQLKVQKELVDNYLDEQGLLKTKIVSLRDQIEAAQEKAKQYVQDANLDTLNELKDKVGLKSARGSGVRISLDDGLFVDRDNPDTINQSLVHAADLRDIINVLRSGEATAIAINDQRIIASTPITSVGNTIMVNNFHLLPPFTISAIGDTGLMKQRLSDPAALPDLQKRVKDMNIRFKAETASGLLLPAYTGNLSLKFISEYKESSS